MIFTCAIVKKTSSEQHGETNALKATINWMMPHRANTTANGTSVHFDNCVQLWNDMMLALCTACWALLTSGVVLYSIMSAICYDETMHDNAASVSAYASACMSYSAAGKEMITQWWFLSIGNTALPYITLMLAIANSIAHAVVHSKGFLLYVSYSSSMPVFPVHHANIFLLVTTFLLTAEVFVMGIWLLMCNRWLIVV